MPKKKPWQHASPRYGPKFAKPPRMPGALQGRCSCSPSARHSPPQPCEMMDERLSTKEAKQQLAGNRKRSIDSAAARLVLESWFAEERARAGDRQ